MNRWAFNLQISFLGSRIQQTMGMISDCKSGVIFQDRTIYEDAHIFADNLHEMGLMATRDIETYMKIFRLVTTLIPKPDLLIYLKASVPTLISQIRKRGREYEMNIDELYLKRLNNNTTTGSTPFTRARCSSWTRTTRISSRTLRCWNGSARASTRSKRRNSA